MTRTLLIGGALTAMIGSSAYWGLARSWGAPVALLGLASLAVGMGVHSYAAEGVLRWVGLGVGVSAIGVVAALIASAAGLEAVGSPSGSLITGLFVLFAVATALFGIVSLVSGGGPGLAGIVLALGAPLLALGVVQERLGDVGFVLTTVGFILLGIGSESSSSQVG